jgi:hypothetical protein
MGIRCSQRERPATAVNALSLSADMDSFRVVIFVLNLNVQSLENLSSQARQPVRLESEGLLMILSMPECVGRAPMIRWEGSHSLLTDPIILIQCPNSVEIDSSR